MASVTDPSNQSGHRKRASQDSRGFVYIPGEDIPGETKAQNQRTATTPNQSGTFHQYERIDLDPLNPTVTDAILRTASDHPGSERDVSSTPSLGRSDRDNLLVHSGKPGSPKKSNDIPEKQSMQAKAGKVPKRGGNSGQLSPPRGADPTVGAKLASHSPERERIHGYSFPHHDCRIRSGGTTSPRWDDLPSTKPIGTSKAPVPVPRSKRETSRPSSSTSSSTTAGPTSPLTTTGSEGANPLPKPPVIIIQPGKDDPPSSKKSPTSGPSPKTDRNNAPSTSQNTKEAKSKKVKEAESKSKNPHVNGIPQTNLMIGLLVTCCFNPPLGIIAMAISLRAAEAYRDGDPKKGACRARLSIIISLISIMLTMVVVSTLLVYTAVDKHGYGKKKGGGGGSKSVLPFGF
ncbi:hypothetical protein ElyMa_005991800 [Elysia marginata]|uniref:DUF4190 domain-containing protein n=1 Tax=Elysia marginata TaxID=1093978 RepID=A0AAV4GGA7_9GAST|nr:hypothetical protein ElyMa_005991800 [Elysia marginata]